MPTSMIAGGDINPCRFVTIDTTSGETWQVTQSTTNQKVYGISQEGTRKAPGIGFSNDTLAAQDTEQLNVFNTDEDECLPELGSGGCTQGDDLKSDNVGKGVTALTSGTTLQQVGAVALQNGSAGEKVRVRIKTRSILPAVS